MKPKRDHNFFEQWARRNGMKPIERITDIKIDGQQVGDVLLADSEDLLLLSNFPPNSVEHKMFCFYRTGFAIDRPGDKTWIASYNDYPIDSFSEYAGAGRQQARLDEALEHALRALKSTYEVGLYRGNDRQLRH